MTEIHVNIFVMMTETDHGLAHMHMTNTVLCSKCFPAFTLYSTLMSLLVLYIC